MPAIGNGVGDAKHHGRSLRASVGRRARHDDSERGQSVSGKSGTSAPVEVTLPQRPFHNPLARALVEERRDLILDPDHAPKRVETALTGLSVAPELFDTPANVYLGLKQANALARSRAQRRRSPRRRSLSLGDGAADRGRRRHAGRARPARRRAGSARGFAARRERRGDQEADAEPARRRTALRQRDGEECRADPQEWSGAGPGSRQADGSDGRRRAQRHAGRG